MIAHRRGIALAREPAAPESGDRMVRVREAKQILGVSRSTLYRMPIRRIKITDGQTGAVGWWLSDLLRFLHSRTPEA